jgi:hypothetical protein
MVSAVPAESGEWQDSLHWNGDLVLFVFEPMAAVAVAIERVKDQEMMVNRLAELLRRHPGHTASHILLADLVPAPARVFVFLRFPQ